MVDLETETDTHILGPMSVCFIKSFEHDMRNIFKSRIVTAPRDRSPLKLFVRFTSRSRERLRFRRRLCFAEAALVSLDWFVHLPTTPLKFDSMLMQRVSQPLQWVALLRRQLERIFSGWIRFSHHSFPLQTEIYLDFWFNSELQPFPSLSLRIEDLLRCVGAMSFKF